MSTRNTILNALKTELKSSIVGSGNYLTKANTVKRGIYMFADISPKPAICFWCYRDATDGDFGGDGVRWLHIIIYGYTKGMDEIHDLARDVEYFLYNDFSYTEDVLITSDMVIYEGGTRNPANEFGLEFRIKYDFTTSGV